MNILIMLVFLTEVVNTHHQYHDFNNLRRHRREELLDSNYHHMRNLRHGAENLRQVKLIPKTYSHPFKTKHSFENLLTSDKIRASRQEQQKKEKRDFGPRNFRQSSNRQNDHFFRDSKIRNIKSQSVEKSRYGHFPAIRPFPLLSKKNSNAPGAGVAFNKYSKPFISYRNPPVANPQARVLPNIKIKRYNVAPRPNKREDVSKNQPRQKKSLFQRFYVGDTLYMVELFFIFIPLVSFSAVVLAIVHHCWSRRFRKAIHPQPPLEQHSESTIGSALLEEHTHPPSLTKSQSEIWRNLITNEIDADGDKVGKRAKLERWMYQKCKCCPEEGGKVKNKLKYLRLSKPQNEQTKNNKATMSESNLPFAPNPRLPPRIEPPVENPFPDSSKQEGSAGDSRYPKTVNPSDQNHSLRTFDSHVKIPQKIKDKRNRRDSKNSKRKEKGLKDSRSSKYSSEPFGVYDKTHKTRKH